MNLQAQVKQRVAKLRIQRGFSYEKLAERTGLSKSTLQRYEVGSIENIPLNKIGPLAEALGTTSEYLLFGDVSDANNSPSPALLRQAISTLTVAIDLISIACNALKGESP